MAKSTALTVRIDPNVKDEADAVLNYLGMTTSEAIAIFLRQVALTGGIPFAVKVPDYNKETLAAFDDVSQKKNLSKTFDSVADLMRDLNA